MSLVGDALLVLGALALFGERLVDRILTPVWPDVEAGSAVSKVYRRARGIVGIALVSDMGGKWLTALLIGGGAAPAHELVRYVENKKAKAKEEKAQEEANTKVKLEKASEEANTKAKLG